LLRIYFTGQTCFDGLTREAEEDPVVVFVGCTRASAGSAELFLSTADYLEEDTPDSTLLLIYCKIELF